MEMTARAALQKATITTTTASAALLSPEKSARLFRVLREKAALSGIRQDMRRASSGNVNKITTARRLIRGAVENNDDGYRAEPTFPTVPYVTKKIRLPWEITEDAIHENVEGEQLEATIESEMTDAWSLDLEDLGLNGDTAAGAGPDQAFFQIDDGWLKLIAANAPAGRRVNGGTINAGVLTKAHFFAAVRALPNKYRGARSVAWIMSPNRATTWQEYLTDRATSGGDAALSSDEQKPLGIPIVASPSMPDSRILLTQQSNLVRVVSWAVRRRRVTGETDWGLANTDKRGYVYHMKADHIVDEYDALVDIYGLV